MLQLGQSKMQQTKAFDIIGITHSGHAKTRPKYTRQQKDLCLVIADVSSMILIFVQSKEKQKTRCCDCPSQLVWVLTYRTHLDIGGFSTLSLCDFPILNICTFVFTNHIVDGIMQQVASSIFLTTFLITFYSFLSFRCIQEYSIMACIYLTTYIFSFQYCPLYSFVLFLDFLSF